MSINTVKLDEQKLRGGYYTPHEITEFICSWAIDNKDLKVLEPSCGDGNFVEASIKRFLELGISEEDLYGRLKAVELIPDEAEKARERAKKFGLNSDTVVNNDFFSYISDKKKEKFDVVVGNPPFIRYQNFPEAHRTLAIKMMQDLGLKPNKLTNIWVPFLVISASLLNDNGKLGMVIPAELFQVKYAAETRVFLSKFFSRITIIAFKKLVFKGIQQEVVLLLCEKEVESAKGIRVFELDYLDELKSIDFNHISSNKVKSIDHSTEKWTKYFLDENEIKTLRKIKKTKKIPLAHEVLDVDVGIVTGRNKFFMMKESQVASWKVEEHTINVVSKSNQLKGIEFFDKDFQANTKADHPIHLFLPPNEPFEKLPKNCQDYIRYGEEQNFHTGYKCRIRKRWYITPSLWQPKGFALRQVNIYPKLILNHTDATSTDTVHRVKFISDEYSPEDIVICFLNSLTFAFSEITGRSYGGGVMTFEPTEIEALPIPVMKNHGINLSELDALMRKNEIEKVLDIVDKRVLVEHYGFSIEEVKSFRKIWRRLSNRRVGRGKSAKSK